MSIWLIAGCVFLLLLWLILPKKKMVKGDDLPVWPFEPMPLMTDSEVLFFHKLEQALPEYRIFSQVQLSRMIEPTEDVGKERQFWFNRVCRQSVDFVLVDKDLQTVLLAIELDDWTHESQARQRQDAKKDKALASAGIPIMRFHAEKMPSSQIIRHDVLQVLRQYHR